MTGSGFVRDLLWSPQIRACTEQGCTEQYWGHGKQQEDVVILISKTFTVLHGHSMCSWNKTKQNNSYSKGTQKTKFKFKSMPLPLLIRCQEKKSISNH